MKHVFAALMLFLAPAFASDDPLFVDGRYEEAVKAALAHNTAEGYADAARAALADADSRSERCLSCLKRAEGYARRAIAADSRMAYPRVYLAVALGLETRIEGYIAAGSKGYATEAKSALDEAIALDPANVRARAGLGGWNIEVVRGGGPVLAGVLYGATLERGRSLYTEAIRLEPDNIAIRYHYALTLAGYDADRFQSEIEENLAHVAGVGANTAYDRMSQKRAAELLALLRTGDHDKFSLRVRQLEGFVTTPVE